MDLEKFIQRQIPGLNVLRMSSPTYIPCSIIDTKQDDLLVGHLKSIFKKQPAGYWSVDFLPANILVGDSLSGQTSLDASATFLGVFTGKTAVARNYKIEYTIDKITTSEFKITSQLEIEQLFRELKKGDRKQWAQYKKLSVIAASFYAESFSLKFIKSGKVTAEAELKKDITINADVKSEWSKEGVVTISRNKDVPFGVRAFRVKD